MADPDKAPKNKPKGEPEKDKPSVDTVTLSRTDFENMQKTNLDLQDKIDKSETEKAKIQRDIVYNELKLTHPKLAKINEEADENTLKAVLATAKEMKTDFPSLNKEGEKPVKNPLDVGTFNPNDGTWI